ncbi:MAG TPA: shikimate kinase [Planctomycetota bacterium]|nr:shikimate kinase [Planctomycetota bacterium]
MGLPGSGKTVVGEALAERLNRSFLDFDREIERREGTSIAEIFAVRGEPYFRQLEVELTLELRQCGNMVVAPGGGWVTNKGVVEIIRPPARLIYLKVKPDTALKRLGAQRAARPLLSRPDPLGELRRFLVEREKLYEQADHVVVTEVLDVKRVVEKLAELASTIKAG